MNSKHLNRAIATFLVFVLCMISFPFAVAAEPINPNSSETLSTLDSYKAIDEILAKINAKYGTNIHRVTAKEALEKYGIVLNESTSPKMTADDLAQIEEKFKYTAEVEIPKYNRITDEVNKKAEELSLTVENNDLTQDSTLNATTAIGPVTATSPITYATAIAVAYIEQDLYGKYTWAGIIDKGCYTNIYNPHSFLALGSNITVSKIDLGRTLYWQGTGDYMSYVNGTLYYDGSGAQAAYMYVGNFY